MKKKQFTCFLLALILSLFICPHAMADSDMILIRRYDTSHLDQGVITLAVTCENELNMGDMEFQIAGVNTIIEGNPEKTIGQDFLYILVLDESAPYYYRATVRQNSHVLCMVEAVKQVIDKAEKNARFCFVWAGPNQGMTALYDKQAAKQALDTQQKSLLSNYQDGNTTANLPNALSVALQIAHSNPAKVTSVVLFSDCCDPLDNASAKFIEAGVPLHVWAILHSKITEQGNSDAGRKIAQTESTKTGGVFEEWDIGAYPSGGTEVTRVTIGWIGNTLYNQENGTKNYTLRFPESAMDQARLSQDKTIQVKYRGNVSASRIASDLRLNLLPTPSAAAEPSPSPTPHVIYFGDTAPEVLKLQEILQAKGYYSGPRSGKYEADTRAALQAIWRDNEGQDPEGGYEAWTDDLLNRLQNYGVKITPKPEVIELSEGDQGEYVMKLQDKLYQLGYYHRLQRSADNTFDADTQEAVNRFCRENGISLTESGCSKEVFEKILAADEKTQQYKKPALVELTFGEQDQNDDHYVELLQNELYTKGYLSAGYQFGALDALTIEALQAICDENGWEMPASTVSVEIQQRIKTANTKGTAAPIVTSTPLPDVIYLHLGDSGDYVIKLQNQLSNLGFYHRLKVSSGVFDQDTQRAVERFCEQIGQTPPNEGCPEQMFRLILGSTIKYKPPIFVDIALNEKDQDEDHYIETLQNELHEKGYLDAGYQLGVMDNKTMAAVLMICSENGWPAPSDVVTVDLQQRIRTASAKAVPTAPPAYKTLSLNDFDDGSSAYVRAMQDRLMELGYFGDQAPTLGMYDEVTAEAVSLFMQQNSMNGNGTTITAQQLENKLFGENHPRQKTVSDQFIQFALSDVEIIDYRLPMWAILAVLVVLIFTIAIVLIMAGQRKKKKEDTSSRDGNSHTPFNVKEREQRLKADARGNYDKETESASPLSNTIVGNEDAPTDSNFSGLNEGAITLHFDITYGGTAKSVTLPLTDHIRIGRKSEECDLVLDSKDFSASRKHCEIYRANGQVMVKNLSSSEAGTILNGYRIDTIQPTGSEVTTTMELDIFAASEGGVQLHSGDTLTLGHHTIRVTY